MSKTTGPLMSFDASGQIAQTLVYSEWRGVKYVRRHVIPSNPQTTDQTETRDTFKWLNTLWTFFPSDITTAWNAFAKGRPLTGRNALVKENLSVLRSKADLADFVFSPSVASGPIADAVAITPGSEQLTVAVTAPTLPTGWSIDHAVAAAVRDQDPQDGTLWEVTADTDASDPYSIVLTGLTASELYRVGAWFRYTKPDGSKAYGRALMDSDTPTA